MQKRTQTPRMSSMYDVWTLSVWSLLLWFAVGCGTPSEPGKKEPQKRACLVDTAAKIDKDLTTAGTLESCLLVTGRYSIKADIVIPPGSTIFFAENAAWSIQKGGSLQAVGTAKTPIVFRSESGATSSWRGLFFHSKSTKNRLSFVEVLHAGHESALLFDKTAIGVGENGALHVSNSLIAGSGGFALIAHAGAQLNTFTNNTIEQCTSSIRIAMDGLGVLDGSNRFKNNTESWISVPSDELTRSVEVRATQIPYLIEKQVQVHADLKLSPGVTFLFAQNAALSLKDKGSLHAVGTAKKQIFFKGKENQPGYWRGLAFQSKKTANALEYAVVSGGGSSAFIGVEPANIVMFTHAALSLQNSTIQSSAGHGLYVVNDAVRAALSFSKNVFADNAKAPVFLPAQLMDQLDAASTFSRNTEAFVVVHGYEDVIKPISIQKLDVPYRIVDRLMLKAKMMIASGTILTFAQNVGLTVHSENGSLWAVGNTQNPILFQGAETIQGYWKGIAFKSSSQDNQLRHVHVLHGGSSGFIGLDPANLSLYAGASTSLENVLLSESGGWGIYAEKGSTIRTKSCRYANNKSGENNQNQP